MFVSKNSPVISLSYICCSCLVWISRLYCFQKDQQCSTFPVTYIILQKVGINFLKRLGDHTVKSPWPGIFSVEGFQIMDQISLWFQALVMSSVHITFYPQIFLDSVLVFCVYRNLYISSRLSNILVCGDSHYSFINLIFFCLVC